MKRMRKIAYILAAPLVLLLALLITVLVAGPPGPHFACHRMLDGAIQQWNSEKAETHCYPNVEGDSRRSIALLFPYVANGTAALRDYRYVPGLCPDDPEGLILFFLSEPSRRTWHGDLNWFWGPKRWIVINPQMSSADASSGDPFGELNEAISLEQFISRLRETLDYLERNDRPYWQDVKREHMTFITSIKK